MLRALILCLLLALPARAAETAAESPVIVELLTSQGCSSCPPADRVLGQVAARDDVIALAFHVSYWNYIGWRDTFATEATTARQYAYAKARSSRNVYTPQAMIGGAADAVGSDAGDIEREIARARPRAARVAVGFDGAQVTV